jgi:hypothetical protein
MDAHKRANRHWLFGYFLVLSLTLILSGCCGDQPIVSKGQINVSVVKESRQGYFSFANLQTSLPSEKPLNLAASDWNNDGAVDLISSYASDMGGLLMLQRGAASFKYPKGNEPRSEPPFDSTAEILEVPLRPDFVFTGDFNHDRSKDILIAQKDASYLYWIAGDGQHFSAGNLIPLPGTITAITVAALDRDIGFQDTILGLQTNDEFQLVIYKGEQKKAFTQPEVYSFANRIDALEVGLLDQDAGNDLAILSAKKLWALMGNPKLTSGIARKPKPIRLRFPLKTFVFGNFNPESTNGLALLSESGKIHSLIFDRQSHWQKKMVARGAWPESSQLLRTRITGNPLDDLAIITGNQVQLLATTRSGRVYNSVDSFDLPGTFASAISLKLNYDSLYDLIFLDNHNPITIALTQPQSIFSVNLLTDESDADTNDGLCDIDLATPNDQCTFRAAIQQANASPGTDEIGFAIADPTIAPINPLPEITDNVNINTSGNNVVELTGTNPGATVGPGLYITAGSSTVRNMVINRIVSSYGIDLVFNGHNTIVNCLIGTDRTGTIDLGNGTGIRIHTSSDNDIGDINEGNLISGNVFGITILGPADQNHISYNLIGTTADGSAALGNNGNGITIGTNGTETNYVFNNTISGNGINGITLNSTAQLTSNRIGVDSTANFILGNSDFGVSIVSDSNFLTANTISGNGSTGVSMTGDDNWISHNIIGSNEESIPLGNGGGGVLIQAGNHNTILDNTIAFNNGFQAPGISVTADGAENYFSANNIYSNSGLGIDLGNDGVTPNDPGDGDDGENGLQNFPVITAATSNGNNVGVTGTLNSVPNQRFRLEIFAGPDCDPSGNGEGAIFVSAFIINTDENGDSSFNAFSPFDGVPAGYFLTATVSLETSVDTSETSEFSSCVQIEAPTSGLNCTIYSLPLSPMAGENVIAFGNVRDENGLPVSDLRLIFRLSTPTGDFLQAVVTDDSGEVISPAFTSDYPAAYVISLDGDGFSCSTQVDFEYCPFLPNINDNLFSLTDNAQELFKIKITDPALDQFTALLEKQFRPQLNEYLRTGSINLTPAQRDSAISLLDLYAAKASPALKRKLLQIRSRLQNVGGLDVTS